MHIAQAATHGSMRANYSCPSMRANYSCPSMRANYSCPSMRTNYSCPSMRANYGNEGCAHASYICHCLGSHCIGNVYLSPMCICYCVFVNVYLSLHRQCVFVINVYLSLPRDNICRQMYVYKIHDKYYICHCRGTSPRCPHSPPAHSAHMLKILTNSYHTGSNTANYARQHRVRSHQKLKSKPTSHSTLNHKY